MFTAGDVIQIAMLFFGMGAYYWRQEERFKRMEMLGKDREDSIKLYIQLKVGDLAAEVKLKMSAIHKKLDASQSIYNTLASALKRLGEKRK